MKIKATGYLSITDKDGKEHKFTKVQDLEFDINFVPDLTDEEREQGK